MEEEDRPVAPSSIHYPPSSRLGVARKNFGLRAKYSFELGGRLWKDGRHGLAMGVSPGTKMERD